MIKKVVSFFAMLIIIISVYGQSAQKMVDDAIAFYQQGNYFEAGKRFEQLTNALIESDPTNGDQILTLSFYGASCYKI